MKKRKLATEDGVDSDEVGADGDNDHGKGEGQELVDYMSVEFVSVLVAI